MTDVVVVGDLQCTLVCECKRSYEILTGLSEDGRRVIEITEMTPIQGPSPFRGAKPIKPRGPFQFSSRS